MTIVRKLPFRLREKWRVCTYRILATSDMVLFEDLATFVEAELDVMKQPLFGDIVDATQKKPPSKPLLKTFSTTTPNQTKTYDDDDKHCYFCNKHNHDILYCFLFKSKSFQEKTEFIKKLGLCFSCLQRGHMSRTCRNTPSCKICNKRHLTVMHNESIILKSPEKPAARFKSTEQSSVLKDYNKAGSSKEQQQTCKISNGAGNNNSDTKILCPIVSAAVGNNNDKIVNVALDSHSSDCWINENLAKELDMELHPTTVNLTTMHNNKKKIRCFVVHNLRIGSAEDGKWTLIPFLYTRKEEDWPFDKTDLHKKEDLETYEHLNDTMLNLVEEKPSILVGMNMPGLLKPLETVNGNFFEPFATRYWLGWAISGPSQRQQTRPKCHRMTTRDIERDLEQLYSQDFIEPPFRQTLSAEDKLWHEKVESSIKTINGEHYEVDLPFKEESPTFPNNESPALKRLEQLSKRFKQNPKFHDNYKKFIEQMIEENFAELVPQQEQFIENGKQWFIVHHAVYHKKKDKLRVVFDCSLNFQGTSLNESLLTRPDFINNLVGVLLRFREEKIAFVADVKQMYYQIKVPEKHSNYLKFYWFDINGQPTQYRLRVHVFGARSSPSIANFALKKCAEDHATTEATKCSINRNFYVDDILRSTEDESEAENLYKDIKTTLELSGFILKGFRSNSPELEGFFKNETTDSDNSFNKTLGLQWNTHDDSLSFNKITLTHPCTRRGVLKTIAEIFDPIGLLAPAVIPAKKIFQETCLLKLDWDETLPPNLLRTWNNWKETMSELENYSVSRGLKTEKVNKNSEIELHAFCDGSMLGYGAVIYVKFIGTSVITSTPLLAKSRVTPLGNRTLKTVPRIELSAAKLAAEIMEIALNELDYNVSRTKYWTDSTIVLAYLQNDTRRFHRFVDNKVSFIRSRSNPEDWYHIASEDNPADLISRGTTLQHLRTSQLWNNGPSILTRDSPPENEKFQLLENDCEIKKEVTTKKTISEETSPVDRLLISSSSRYKTKIRIAVFEKFKIFLKTKTVSTKISVENLNDAEKFIWKYIQSNNTYLSSLKHLSPFVDSDGLLRVGGRLRNSTLPYDSRHPVLLPGTSPTVESLIRETHVQLGHLGRETMLSHLRTRYWIVKGNSTAKKITRNCISCRRYQARASAQVMADLPNIRTDAADFAFTHVGVDYFGPFTITHGRKTEKRYGVIFTCLSTRAMHLEVSHSLTTDSFICSLRRFVSRRGNVTTIVSDNGTNFVGAHRELREVVETWNNKQTEEWLKSRNITWKFNPPSASHYGGIWEREIRSVRKVLSALMKEKPTKLTDENLQTFLCEVEFILNNRPITPISSDPNDIEALTPNHILLLRPGDFLTPDAYSSESTYSKKWKQVQHLSSVFWYRWKKEYVSLLQSRQKWHKSTREHSTGDLVLVIDVNLPRNNWPLARILKMKISEDGRKRTAVLKLSKRNDNSVTNFSTSIIERPISKLVFLMET